MSSSDLSSAGGHQIILNGNGTATVTVSGTPVVVSSAVLANAVMSGAVSTSVVDSNGGMLPEGSIVLMSIVPNKERDNGDMGCSPMDTDGEALHPRKMGMMNGGSTAGGVTGNEHVAFLIQQQEQEEREMQRRERAGIEDDDEDIGGGTRDGGGEDEEMDVNG